MSKNKNDIGQTDVCISGMIIAKQAAAGSKSDREAIYLQTKDSLYLLRRLGGNPFRDGTLLDLKGKTVTVTGILNNNLLLAREIKENQG